MSSIEVKMSAIKGKVSERVAQAIKARRQRLGLALRDLAARSGISSSMISDVERGAKSPTVATLAALAEALGLPVSALFEGPAQRSGRIQVSRATKRSQIVDPGSGAKRDAYRPALATSKVEFVRYAVPARTQAGPFAAHAAGTIEHLHLATGSIRVLFGSDTALLKAGDCCTCIADAEHAFDNRESDVEALMYIVVERP
jgi:transcriptional regulator with XRE-family HTH domain